MTHRVISPGICSLVHCSRCVFSCTRCSHIHTYTRTCNQTTNQAKLSPRFIRPTSEILLGSQELSLHLHPIIALIRAERRPAGVTLAHRATSVWQSLCLFPLPSLSLCLCLLRSYTCTRETGPHHLSLADQSRRPTSQRSVRAHVPPPPPPPSDGGA